MAIIWQYTRNGRHYEVRRAGASLRLYTNGAFHSQYNPNHLLTGAVWDLLTLPVLFQDPPGSRVLMLGVGGGTAILQLNQLVAPRSIVGIELDPVHLQVARRFFKADADNVTLIEADALKWITSSRRKFDVIIDDLFLDAPGDPMRPQPVDLAWLNTLADRLTNAGIMVQNHLSPTAARRLIKQHRASLSQKFASILQFTTPQYENGIVAFYKMPLDLQAGKERALRHVGELSRTALRQARFDCETLLRA